MIATSIDGSNPTIELLSTLLADPTVYADKLKALTEATAENKKYVDLVGPASEIVATRAAADADRAAAEKILANAKVEASGIVGDAKASAEVIVADAQNQADTLVAQAKAQKDESDAILSQAKVSLADVKRAEAEAKAATAAANAQAQSLATAQAATEALQAEVNETKAALLAKTQAFIEGL
jgi:cell division septum initiation protein DivIVA